MKATILFLVMVLGHHPPVKHSSNCNNLKVYFAGISGKGKVNINLVKNCTGLIGKTDSPCDEVYFIESFNVLIKHNGEIKKIKNYGVNFNQEVLSALQQIEVNDKIFITDIYMKSPKNLVITPPSISVSIIPSGNTGEYDTLMITNPSTGEIEPKFIKNK